MKKCILLGIVGVGLLLLTLTGCNKTKEEDKPLESLYQTQWKGTFGSPYSTVKIPVTLAFETATTGSGTYKEERSTFEYIRIDNIIHISKSTANYLFDQDWWIYKMTQSQLELRANVGTTNEDILTLNRIY